MNEITTEELKKLIDNKESFTLLDCRGVDYYNWERLPKAVNLRWKYVDERSHLLLKNKNSLIITSCDGFTCNASVRCYHNLEKAGYTNIQEYSGGIADWVAHGYKTIRNDQYRITDNVYRFPSQTFYHEDVGSYLIEEDDSIVLIDGPQQLTDEHEDFLLHFGKPIRIFMSHGPTAGESVKLQKKYGAKIYLHAKEKNSEWLRVKPDIYFTKNFDLSPNLKVIHTPGHTAGSSVILDTRNKILFSGDHVEGYGAGIYDFIKNNDGTSGDLKMRLAEIKKLLKYDFDLVLPFHYDMIRNNAKKVIKKFLKGYENNSN